jgi:hypothetical protein
MLIDAVNAAYLAGGNAPGKLATELDILNNTGCPLGGTSASPKGGESNPESSNYNDTRISKTDLAGFDAYPVPFRDVLKIKYNFDYVSNVKTEIFNSLGKVILRKFDSNSYLNKEVALTINSIQAQEQVYIVKLTTDRGYTTKKVMSEK